jgi:DNA-binding beta-propeller fold protein YncE
MFLQTLLGWLRPTYHRPSTPARRAAGRLQVEPLEDRLTPSGGSLLVTGYDTNSVLRYNEANGAFVNTFVPTSSGDLSLPYAVLYGPHDHNVYVSSGQFGGPGHLKAILRYDGATGAFLGQFADSTHLTSPRGIIFGPDGNLYVADGNDDTLTGKGIDDGRIVRYNGVTGAFIDEFVPISGNGGMSHPQGLVFAPSVENPNKLDLYVSSAATNSVLRFDGTTGAFLREFVPSGSGGLNHPGGLVFGPDGSLYVSQFGSSNPVISHYEGPSGAHPGAYLGNFVSAGSGGLYNPASLLFGPDGNGDGHQDLYVASVRLDGQAKGNVHTSSVKRYDGVTGAFIDTFVAVNSGGLDDPNFMTFTETNPVTLAYGGATAGTSAAPLSATSALAPLAAAQVHGGGQAVLSDPDGNAFPVTFGLTGLRHSDGSASGVVNFAFGPAFSQLWGAVPGVASIHLHGTVTSITVAADGTVALEGQLTEKDLGRRDGLVFVEENVPFKIVRRPGGRQFTLQWCQLPTFDLELTDGNLAIQ